MNVRLLSALVLVAMCGGCAVRPVTGPPRPAVAPPPPTADYRIGPEDLLEVTVWKNADLSKTVTVRPDGMITLPLIGELRAGGLTADDVRNEIKTRLERYKELPDVTVTVAEVRSYSLYILGEVKAPGRYQVKSYTTVLQALALAGGFTEWADTSEIVVVRRAGEPKDQRLRLRYKDLIRRGDPGLMPGDTLIVQ
ncbi:MAG: polysaccharide biosynthesis/export family protein [Nitrospirota bacterium]